MLSYACTEKSVPFSPGFWPGDSGITSGIVLFFPRNGKNTIILKKFEKSIDKFDFFAIINIAVSTVHLNKTLWYCVKVAQQTLTLFVWVRILVPQPNTLPRENRGSFFEVWLSLVERYVRDVEAAGSNPVTSTMQEKPET